MDYSWRTLILQGHDSLSLKGEKLIIKDGDKEKSVQFDQIREIFVLARCGTISLPLMLEMSKRGKMIIFCDEAYNPISELMSMNINYEAAGRQMDQAKWTERRADSVWAHIVRQKLKNQAELLMRLCIPVPVSLNECIWSVQAGDPDNREGVGAKAYFSALFGDDFVRHEKDDINSALDYGYAIIRSTVSRAITLCGCNPALGIHHIGRQNPVNLSCDIMEPFRPIVDRYVYTSKGKEFGLERKFMLIGMLQKDCLCDGKNVNLCEAIMTYTREVINAMNNGSHSLPEIRFD